MMQNAMTMVIKAPGSDELNFPAAPGTVIKMTVKSISTPIIVITPTLKNPCFSLKITTP